MVVSGADAIDGVPRDPLFPLLAENATLEEIYEWAKNARWQIGDMHRNLYDAIRKIRGGEITLTIPTAASSFTPSADAHLVTKKFFNNQAGDVVPVIDTRAGVGSASILYMRAAQEHGLKLVGSPVDGNAAANPTLEFVDDAGVRGGLQVKIKAADFVAGADGLALASSGGVAAGIITMYGGSSPPTGWLDCDGSNVSQTTYADLFSAISTTYGAPGGGNFTLPSFSNKFARGNTPGPGGGSDTHGHTVTGTVDNASANTNAHGTFAMSNGSGATVNVVYDGSNSHTPIPHGHPFSSGSAATENNIPVYTGVMFIIKT